MIVIFIKRHIGSILNYIHRTISHILKYIDSIFENNTLDHKEKQECEKKLSVNEIYKAVKNLNNNKSPRPDGLTPEFYKTFWPILKDPFMDMLHETYQLKMLPSSTCTAILTLIYKKMTKKC